MHVTVAMCTHNPDLQSMRRALEAVIAQSREVSAADVLLVDNASRPPLAECEALDGQPVALIREDRLGLTAAREAAIEAAKGDVVLFVDDDNIIGPGYLSTVAEAFAGDAALGLLGGRVVPNTNSNPRVARRVRGVARDSALRTGPVRRSYGASGISILPCRCRFRRTACARQGLCSR